MRAFPAILSVTLTVALSSTALMAAEPTGTLKKIKTSGTITLGHRDSSIPFSYIADGSGQPVGYSHDIQLKIVEATGITLLSGTGDIPSASAWARGDGELGSVVGNPLAEGSLLS